MLYALNLYTALYISYVSIKLREKRMRRENNNKMQKYISCHFSPNSLAKTLKFHDTVRKRIGKKNSQLLVVQK